MVLSSVLDRYYDETRFERDKGMALWLDLGFLRVVPIL
jgi:hypothetical protein